MDEPEQLDFSGALIVWRGELKLSMDCCPMCGRQFMRVERVNECGKCGYTSSRESLIVDGDDYAYCV